MKRILITGANKGIGFATVRAILETHADVQILLGSRDSERGAAAVQSLLADNAQWHERLALLVIDVASDDSVNAAFAHVQERWPDDNQPLYAIVNNAGIGLGSSDMSTVVNVNTLGVKRVCDAFLPLLQDGGRVVNVSSASAVNFVSACSAQQQAFFQDAAIQWEQVSALIDTVCALGDDTDGFHTLGLDPHNAYGFSKACTTLYTLLLARQEPRLLVNACTPGYIETDLTRPVAASRGVAPQELGMKSPVHGTVAILHLLFGQPHGSGHYYGSDAKRSPLDRYRAPGSPEYNGAT